MNFIREKWKVLVIILVILIGVSFTIGIMFNSKKDEKRTKVTKEHVMYVAINPQVKMIFTEVYEECTNDNGEKYICSGVINSVKEFEFLNDDAKEFYHELDFKDKTYSEVLIMLCDIARDNKVAFNKIDVVTDSKNVSREEILEEIKENSRYEVNFDVLLDIEQRVVEEEVIEEFEREKVYFTVKFDTNGGSEIDDRLVEENTSLTDLQKPTKEGYVFVKWEYNDKTFDDKTVVTKDITVKAIWKKEEVKTTTKKDKDTTEKTTKETTTKEEVISKTIEKSVKNYKFKKTNLLEDSKKRVSVAALYGCENTIKIVVKGPKSKVESITSKNIELGVDFKGDTEAKTIDKEIYVTNKVDGVEYTITNPSIKARMEVFKKVESTIDKINLNENLLVSYHETSNSWCGNTYVTTNFKEVFKDYISSGNSLYVADDCYGEKNCILRSKFSELSSQLVVDTAKLNKIVADFEKVKNSKIKNLKDFSYNYDLSKGTVGYRYDYLSIADYYIDSLPKSMYKYHPKLLDSYTGVYTTYGGCGTGPGGEVLLTEEICNEFNLVCSRW